MRNTKREIECLIELYRYTSSYEDLIGFLKQQDLLTKEEIRVMRNEVPSETAKLLQARLAKLSAEKKLQLLEYEWCILPVERIRLTMITDSVQKEIVAAP